jgi:hypothetical protein
MKDSISFPENLKELIKACKWTFAKTMPEWPHEYIVREKVDKAVFEALVRHGRQDHLKDY